MSSGSTRSAQAAAHPTAAAAAPTCQLQHHFLPSVVVVYMQLRLQDRVDSIQSGRVHAPSARRLAALRLRSFSRCDVCAATAAAAVAAAASKLHVCSELAQPSSIWRDQTQTLITGKRFLPETTACLSLHSFPYFVSASHFSGVGSCTALNKLDSCSWHK